MGFWIRIIPITYFAFVLQTSCGGLVEIQGVRLHFAILALLLLIPTLTGRAALMTAVCWGLISDGLAHSGQGVDVVCFSLCAFGYWHLQRRFSSHPALIRALLIFPASFLLLLASWFLRDCLTASMPSLTPLVMQAVLTAAYTAGVGLGFTLLSALIRRPFSAEQLAMPVKNRWRMLTE